MLHNSNHQNDASTLFFCIGISLLSIQCFAESIVKINFGNELQATCDYIATPGRLTKFNLRNCTNLRVRKLVASKPQKRRIIPFVMSDNSMNNCYLIDFDDFININDAATFGRDQSRSCCNADARWSAFCSNKPIF